MLLNLVLSLLDRLGELLAVHVSSLAIEFSKCRSINPWKKMSRPGINNVDVGGKKAWPLF